MFARSCFSEIRVLVLMKFRKPDGSVRVRNFVARFASFERGQGQIAGASTASLVCLRSALLFQLTQREYYGFFFFFLRHDYVAKFGLLVRPACNFGAAVPNSERHWPKLESRKLQPRSGTR